MRAAALSYFEDLDAREQSIIAGGVKSDFKVGQLLDPSNTKTPLQILNPEMVPKQRTRPYTKEEMDCFYQNINCPPSDSVFGDIMKGLLIAGAVAITAGAAGIIGGGSGAAAGGSAAAEVAGATTSTVTATTGAAAGASAGVAAGGTVLTQGLTAAGVLKGVKSAVDIIQAGSSLIPSSEASLPAVDPASQWVYQPQQQAQQQPAPESNDKTIYIAAAAVAVFIVIAVAIS